MKDTDVHISYSAVLFPRVEECRPYSNNWF